MKISSFAILAMLAVLPGVSLAETVVFSTSSYTQNKIGDEIGSDLDQFSIDGASDQSLTFSGSTTATIATYAFLVGGNCTACVLTPSYDAVFQMTLGGQTQTISIPYSWSSIGSADQLAFGQATTPVSFNLGHDMLTVTALIPPKSLVSSGGTESGNLQATFSITSAVPEPETYAMLLAGLGLLGVRRKARASLPN